MDSLFDLDGIPRTYGAERICIRIGINCIKSVKRAGAALRSPERLQGLAGGASSAIDKVFLNMYLTSRVPLRLSSSAGPPDSSVSKIAPGTAAYNFLLGFRISSVLDIDELPPLRLLTVRNTGLTRAG
jgi:hypothetical protein